MAIVASVPMSGKWPNTDLREYDTQIFLTDETAKVSKLNVRIYEVGISYYGRTYLEGKKIGWKDGVRALYCIVKYNLFR